MPHRRASRAEAVAYVLLDAIEARAKGNTDPAELKTLSQALHAVVVAKEVVLKRRAAKRAEERETGPTEPEAFLDMPAPAEAAGQERAESQADESLPDGSAYVEPGEGAGNDGGWPTEGDEGAGELGEVAGAGGGSQEPGLA